MFCDERGGEIVAASKTQQEVQGRNPMYGGAHCLLVPFLDSVQHPQVMMGFFILSQKRASHSQQPDGGDVSAQQAPPCPFSPFVIRRLSSAEQDLPGTYLFHVPRFLFVENRLHSASLLCLSSKGQIQTVAAPQHPGSLRVLNKSVQVATLPTESQLVSSL